MKYSHVWHPGAGCQISFIGYTLKLCAYEVNNINTTTLALKGVSKLIQKGLTLSEIKYLTGFETKKIEDVSRWLMNQEDVESVINNKLNLIDI